MTGRTTLLWMIPLNLLLVAWVWIGRLVFGVGGWFFLIFLITIVPVLLVALLVTTILAFTQPGRPRHLTGSQKLAQWTMWAAMFAFGVVAVDFGDTEDSEISALTQLFGRSETMLSASWTLELVFGAITVIAWVALLVTLTAGRRKA